MTLSYLNHSYHYNSNRVTCSAGSRRNSLMSIKMPPSPTCTKTRVTDRYAILAKVSSINTARMLWPHQDCTMDFKYHSPKGILSININRKTILARILLKKLQTHLEGTSQDLPPEKNTSPLWTQCGFRQDRGTVSGNSTRSVASRIKVSRSH